MSDGAAELGLLRNWFFFQSNFNERFWWCMRIKLNMVFFDEFSLNGFQLYTSLSLIKRRCGCQIWKYVFVLKIRGLDNFSCNLNWYQKKVQSLQNSVQKTVCKKFLLHLQNLSLYLTQFTPVIFSGSGALFICLDLNKMRGFLWKSDRRLPSYAPKTILGPFSPNSHTRTQSPFETKFSEKPQQSIGHKILNKVRGYL